ncbi:MAG TPA: transposase [Balneolaceae bacterium]
MMRWNRHHRNRKSIRLKGWDYRTPAWYFLTIVTKDRRHFFGEIRKGVMGLSETGGVAWQNWAAIPDHFDHIKLDAFIIMPNHIHSLIGVMERLVKRGSRVRTSHGMSPQEDSEAKFGNLKSGSVSTIVNHYKGSVTRWARKKDNYDFGW